MKHEFRGQLYTIQELSEMSGLKPHTVRDRLRRGFSVEQAVKVTPIQESVQEFSNASYWKDWIGMSINDLYEIYWKWCIANGYTTIQKQGFSRQITSIYPMLKTVPTKRGESCHRIIRLRG